MAQPEPAAVFSIESSSSGTRKFLACTLPELWRRYRACPPPARHYYEIIRHGAPCRLYLDLEFAREANTAADGAGMTGLLLLAIAAQLEVRARSAWTPLMD